ncbi:DUF4259 domain-containing protein [Streptomyces sp. NPDC085946]|uniref:DUF4259 domain-containing protein n=1 Tax=Streptomyces sp. NPDC085946 TaxID=3365744 RepID=UPI0037D152D4
MGTWGIDPFDNDMAADFVRALDGAAPEEREAFVRAALARAVRTRDYLESPEGAEAVAAAALVAAQCPGGAPVRAGHGPREPLPRFSGDLRPLAVEALDRVAAGASEVAELWDETPDGPAWRRTVGRLRAVLAAGSPARETPPPAA